MPVLIDLIDHKNWNVRVYTKVGLCETTGVHLGDSKEAWRKWWNKNK